jgi:IS5 family transposase
MTLWTPALDRHIEIFGRAPYVAAADRGFSSAKNEDEALARVSTRDSAATRDGKPRRDARTNDSAGSVAGSGGGLGAKDGFMCSNDDMVFDAVASHGADGIARWVGLGVIADNLVNTGTFLYARAA